MQASLVTAVIAGIGTFNWASELISRIVAVRADRTS